MRSLLLLGLTETAAFPLYVLIGLYLVLPVFAILGNWSRASDCRPIRPWQFLVFPAIAFIALWLCGRMIWFLFLWLWGGDGLAEYANLIAVLFALVFSGILLVRLSTGWVSGRYLRLNAWGIGLCVGLLGAVYLLEIADSIDGWTARGAAEKKFAYLMKPSKFYPGHLPRRIVDETTPPQAVNGGKAFTLYIGDSPAAEVRVVPYYRLWWTVSNFRTTPFAGENLSTREQFERFRESLKK